MEGVKNGGIARYERVRFFVYRPVNACRQATVGADDRPINLRTESQIEVASGAWNIQPLS